MVSDHRYYEMMLFREWLWHFYKDILVEYRSPSGSFYEEGEAVRVGEPELYATWRAQQRLGIG